MNKDNKNIEYLGTQSSAAWKSEITKLLSVKDGDSFLMMLFKKVIIVILYIPKKIARVRRTKNLTSFYHKHRRDVENLSNMVEDDISREVIATQINFIINYDYSGQQNFLQKSGLLDKHSKLFDADHYFSKNIIHLSDNEGFVNCGSHIGDTVEDFVKRTNHKFKHIFAFEPSPVNFAILQSMIKKLRLSSEVITPYRKGVYSENTELNFNVNTEDGVHLQ